MSQKILLLTKNYPPQIGGIEKYTFDLVNKLSQEGNTVKLIAAAPRNETFFSKIGNKSSLRNLPYRFLYFTSEAYRFIFLILRSCTLGIFYGNKSDLIWCMDGSLAGLGLFLHIFTRAPVRVTLHGTDIVWKNPLYQKVMPYFWKNIQEFYAVSENTRLEAIKRGIIDKNILLAPNTLDNLDYANSGIFDKRIFFKNLGISVTENKIFLFSLGRWIERKGFHWFLAEILPLLNPEKFHYILAGFGPYESEYKRIISNNNLKNVTLLGKVEDPIFRARLYSSSHAFIMPNLLVQKDIEGHPLVLLEAKFYRLKRLIGFVQGADQDEDTIFCGNDIDLWLTNIGKL